MKLSGVSAAIAVSLCFAATTATAADMAKSDGMSAPRASLSGLVLPANALQKAKPQARIQLAGRRWRRRRGAYVAGAIALGVLGAIAASEAARADRHRARRYSRKCRRWLHSCEHHGRIRSCDKYDYYC